MRGYAHVALGTSLTLLLLGPRPECLIASVIFSTFPDYDIAYKHRKLLHNVFALGIVTILTSFISTYFALAAMISYLSHLLGDMMTVRGVALFYPFSNRYFRIARFRSDSLALNLGAVLFSILIALLALTS